MRALLYDADDQITAHYGRLLGELGFDVARTTTVADATRLAPEADAVFLEPMSMGGAGILFLSELNRLEKRPKIIALTAFPLLMNKLPGIDATLEKPVSFGALKDTADALVAGRAPRSSLRAKPPERLSKRTEAIMDLHILDGALDAQLEAACSQAAKMFDTEVAFVSVVMTDKQRVQASFGLPLRADARERPLRDSVCQNVVESERALELPDLGAVPALEENWFKQEGVIGSYLGAPIMSPDGIAVGALCIADRTPHRFEAADAELLSLLARRLSDELATRDKTERDRARAYRDPSGAWTRVGWTELVEKALERGTDAAVFVIGFDRHEEITERLGREGWDDVLAQAIARLRKIFGETAELGRTGDAELSVFRARLAAADAPALADLALADLRRWGYAVPGTDAMLTAGVGVATVDNSPTTVVARAQWAMKQARRRAQPRVLESVAKREDEGQGEMPEPGWVIDKKYLIERQLSAGGMGVVYAARDLNLDRAVALKVIRRELRDSPGFIELFRKEAQGMAAVRHRHLAAVYAFGEDVGRPFLAMELVRGFSASQLIERHGALAPPQVATIVTQIAAALDALHAAGLVHRDVKPANILFDATVGAQPPAFGAANEGRAVLIDFGLLTRSKSPSLIMGGTPGFIAPEAMLSAEVTAQADVYSLAASALRMLTGGSDLGALPAIFAPVFAKGLDVDAARRYATASAFASALEAVIERAQAAGVVARRSLASVAPQPSEGTTDPRVVRGALLAAVVDFGPRAEITNVEPARDYPIEVLERLLASAARGASDRAKRRMPRAMGHRAVEWGLERGKISAPLERGPEAFLSWLPTAWRAIIGPGRFTARTLEERGAHLSLAQGYSTSELAELTAGVIEAIAIQCGLGSPLATVTTQGPPLELIVSWI